MKITRRRFGLSLAAAPHILRAQSGPLRARLKIDTERVIGDIDPKIYGNFIEHLGRCIDGGVFEEHSPLSDANGYRKDVLEAARKLNVTLLRWPGGNFSSNYRWMDGIGPRDQRPPRLEMAWGTVESNRFGTHEFLNYAEMLKTEPYICCNLGTGTWNEAQQWVEYCNSSEDTAMTRLRKQNGRQAPWKVTYWGLGNEMDGPWQMGHRSAEDYGKFALEAAKLMKWTDPNVKLIAAGSSNFGPGLRLDRMEPHRARVPAPARRLPRHPHVRRQPEQRFRRLPGQFRGTGPSHQDHRRHHRRSALRPAGQSQNPHRLG